MSSVRGVMTTFHDSSKTPTATISVPDRWTHDQSQVRQPSQTLTRKIAAQTEKTTQCFTRNLPQQKNCGQIRVSSTRCSERIVPAAQIRVYPNSLYYGKLERSIGYSILSPNGGTTMIVVGASGSKSR